MLDIYFVTLYLIFPLLVFKYMRVIDIDIFKISIPMMVITSMFIYAYIGIIVLYFGWIPYRYELGVQDKTIIFQMLLGSMASIIFLLAGFTYCKYILNLNKFQNFNYIEKASGRDFFYLCVIVLFCTIILLLFLSQVPRIAFFAAIEEGHSQSQLARSVMTHEITGASHWYSLMDKELFYIATFCSFSAFLLSKKIKILFLFIISFLICSFGAVMYSSKGPFIHLLLGLLFTYSLTKQKGRIPIKAMIIFVIVAFCALILFYIYFMGSQDIEHALMSILSRVSTGQLTALYFYLEYFPRIHDFLFGGSFPNPGGIIPVENFNIGIEIMNYFSPNSEGIIGTAPTVFWGEAYANFGFVGIPMVSFFVGIAVYLVNYIADKIKNTPLKIGFYVWFIGHFSKLATSGFSSFLVDFYALAIIVIFVMSLAAINGRIEYFKIIKFEKF